MNREDIIRMAREAGFADGVVDIVGAEGFANFAALVAAAEREACAKLVEPSAEHRRDASWGYLGGKEGVDMLDEIAAAIRARSEI